MLIIIIYKSANTFILENTILEYDSINEITEGIEFLQLTYIF